MVAPPPPESVAENSSSPREELFVIMLLCTFTSIWKQSGMCWLATRPAPLLQEPGAALVALPTTYGPANSPWPTLMPPVSVPAWLKMRPPPWELSVTLKPSMLDGLQVKLLGYGLVSLVCVIVPFAL